MPKFFLTINVYKINAINEKLREQLEKYMNYTYYKMNENDTELCKNEKLREYFKKYLNYVKLRENFKK